MLRMQEQGKLLLSNFQVMGSFGDTFGDVEWPDMMATFRNIKDAFEFDIMALFAVDCFDDAGYLLQFYSVLAVGLTVVAGFPSLYWLIGSLARLRCRTAFEGDSSSIGPGASQAASWQLRFRGQPVPGES